jgi:phosphotriesterase-related protein
MSTVHTIRGPIDSAELGSTLSHEHFSTSTGGADRIPGLMDTPERRQEMVDRCVEALATAYRSGIQSIIDLTPHDLGRQAWLFEAVAERHDEHQVNVVCATGVYRWVPPVFFAWTEDEVAEHFTREIEVGIGGGDRPGPRAGIIKLAWDLEARLADGPRSPRAMLEKMARGAARAAKATGVPISCHTLATDKLGIPLLDIFDEEGLDLRAVTIGHSNDTDDMEYLTGLAKRGATVGLDRFFATTPEYVDQRGGIARGLAEAGYAEQTCLGHDAQPAGFWGRWNPERRSNLWTLVPDVEVPWLLDHGVSADQVDGMLRRSIRATFEAAAAMKR